MNATWLIWDTEGQPPQGGWNTVLWNSFNNNSEAKIYSIPTYIEEHADKLRSRFLDLIYEFSQVQNRKGERLVDCMELRPGFSYWWMTLIAEKSNAYKSPQITDIFKMFAFEDLVGDHSVSTIILKSKNHPLAQVLKKWCKKSGLIFNWQSFSEQSEKVSFIKRVYHSSPWTIQALSSLIRYIWKRWPMRHQRVCRNKNDTCTVTFVDYLIHLDPETVSTGQFASNFWTGLIDILKHSGLQINWLHHYIEHQAVPSPKKALDLVARFNQNKAGKQYHFFPDYGLSVSLIFSTLIDYGRLVWMSIRLNWIETRFRPKGSRLDFWPFFKGDWYNSMRGPTAIWNCLCLNLFEKAMGRLPHQKLGVYLQENQGWEMAFIYAWRAAGHGRLIGVPHSTVRYWDLRYFHDRRSYQRTGKNYLPTPDKAALNGPVAKAVYRKAGYPEENIIEVEALRYLHLTTRAAAQVKDNVTHDGPLKVLIFGDYMYSVTRKQMEWLVEAAKRLPPETCYTVKSHPACPILSKDYPSLQFHMGNAPLGELLADCDVAFTGNITSAAVDAYCANVPVISSLEGNTLNMSPLRGLEGVFYVTGPKELAETLSNIQQYKNKKVRPFFYLDKELPRWRTIFDLDTAYKAC